MDQVKKSVYSYLNMEESPYKTDQESRDYAISVPWVRPASTLFEWWIYVEYDGNAFEKQLDISITDFKQKFLKHPYYCEDVFFNVDNDPEDDLKVSFGFYWENILNTKTNVEHKSLEDMVRVRQINNVSYIGLGGGGVGASGCRSFAGGVLRCRSDPSGGGKRAGSTVGCPGDRGS